MHAINCPGNRFFAIISWNDGAYLDVFLRAEISG
jgi:hypothetical protein